MNLRSHLTSTTLLLALATGAPGFGGVVIDDFSTAQGPLAAPGPSDFDSSSATGAGILGGERFAAITRVTSLEVTGGALQVIQEAFSGMARLDWNGGGSGLGPADLTDGGTADRFLIDFSQVQVSEQCTYAGVFNILVFDGEGNDLLSDPIEVTTAGILEVLFSDMNVRGAGLDPAAAPMLALDFQVVQAACQNAPFTPGSFTIDSFTTGGPAGGDDEDGDGVVDDDDLCPGSAGMPVDTDGCSDDQVDGDGDGWCDVGAPSPGPSSCLGTDNCPTVANPDQTDANGDGFGDACVDPAADVDDRADLDPTATIGPDSTVDRGAIIGPDVVIGSDVEVDRDVEIGAGTTVGDGTSIDRGASIGAGAILGDNVGIGQGVVIEDGAVIGDGAIIQRDAYIGEGAMVGAGAVVGRNTVVCATAQIAPGVSLGRNTFLDTGSVQTTDTPAGGIVPDLASCTALP